MKKIIQVTTYPFGSSGSRPREVLECGAFDVRYNPHGRRLKASEVADLVADAHAIVAGTEPYTAEVIARARRLEVIARVGVGLDNVDLQACLDRGIEVTYTPEAPADAVAELTVGHILALLRFVHQSDRSVRERAWNRFLGYLVRERTIGILGVGRIGSRVARLLQPFQPQLVGCDTDPARAAMIDVPMRWVGMDELFATCDLVSVHVPLTDETRRLVAAPQLQAMREGSFLVNTSRGGVVDEFAVADALRSGRLAGAALDVFAVEPYEGALIEHDNVILTAHMGASAHQSRYLMELGAAEDCVRVLQGQAPRHRAVEDGSVRLVPRVRTPAPAVPPARAAKK